MVPYQLEILALVAVLIGIVVNSYIVVIVILTKQITFASKILLLHLGVVNAVLCLFYLVFYTASLFQLLPVALDAMDVACLMFGLCFNTLHSIALWTLCALNFDRYFAIATPLHYGTFINTKKQVLITLGAGWIVSTLFSLPQAVRISAYKFDSDYELCLPNLQTTESLIYSISFVLFTILLPIVLILGCNMKVLMIARYQRNRIASAILEVTLSAQLTITHQRNPFFVPNAGTGPAGSGPAADCKPYTQASNQNNPAANVIQLVGSAILFHCPYYFVILWNSMLPFVANGWRTPALLLNLASFLLLLSPTINAILYGVRSKIVRRSFRNIWRKQKQKIEIHYEIQARTPSTCGSRRPSLSGTQFQQQQLQQQQQPLLLAFATDTSRPGSATGGVPAPDTRSEIGLETDGCTLHDASLQSPLSRVKFGSCSALSGPLFVCNPTPPNAQQQHLHHHHQAHHTHHGAGPRPKITITKIHTDDDAPGILRSPPPPPSSPLSPTTSAFEHHGFDIAAAAVDGGRLPAALVATIPPICTTDNLSVAGQSGAKLHPAPLSAGPICLEPKISFRKFSSLQEILGNGTD